MQLCRLCLFKHLWRKRNMSPPRGQLLCLYLITLSSSLCSSGRAGGPNGVRASGFKGGWEGYLRGCHGNCKGVLRVIKPGKKMQACLWWRIPSHGQVSSHPWSRSVKFAQIRSTGVNGCLLGREKGHTGREKSESSGIKMQWNELGSP